MMEMAQAATTGGNLLTSILPFVFMFVIFYFLLIRPQQKRTKQRNAMLSALKKNDKVVTIGGVHGTVVDLTDDIVVLKVSENTKLTFDRHAINTVIPEDSSVSN